ncbi:hypothetical protein YC2023_001505 [Brassica napus]
MWGHMFGPETVTPLVPSTNPALTGVPLSMQKRTRTLNHVHKPTLTNTTLVNRYVRQNDVPAFKCYENARSFVGIWLKLQQKDSNAKVDSARLAG